MCCKSIVAHLENSQCIVCTWCACVVSVWSSQKEREWRECYASRWVSERRRGKFSGEVINSWWTYSGEYSLFINKCCSSSRPTEVSCFCFSQLLGGVKWVSSEVSIDFSPKGRNQVSLCFLTMVWELRPENLNTWIWHPATPFSICLLTKTLLCAPSE